MNSHTVSTPADRYDYLIVGGGMVADNAAKALQGIDPNATVGIIGRDPDEPVTRPALTKKLWTDPDFGFDQVWLKTVEQTGAHLITGTTVDALDTQAHEVSAGGRTVGYRRLLLATGGDPQRLDLPEDDRIIAFRTVEDYRRLRNLSGNGRRIAVVGGGYIGTELAAGLVQNDTEVVMIFPQDLVYGDKFPAPLAERLTELYAEHGVQLVPGRKVTGASTNGGVQLELDDGSMVRADAAVVGLGITPNTQLAEQAGLQVEDGVVVNEFLTTSDPDVLAAGDVASYPDRILGRQRVEHVDNANAMGTQAGRNLAGAYEPYVHTPYFYSVLFGNRYEAVGTLDASARTAERWHTDGDNGQAQGIVHYLDDEGRVTGVLHWNVPDRTDDARAAIGSPSPLKQPTRTGS